MRVGHITVLTKNMEQSVDFYTILGGTKISDDVFTYPSGKTRHTVHMKFDGDITIELTDPSYKDVKVVETTVLEHFCFEVEDVDAIVNDLRANGIDSFTYREPYIEPHFGTNGIRIMFLKGPSGEAIELLQRL